MPPCTLGTISMQGGTRSEPGKFPRGFALSSISVRPARFNRPSEPPGNLLRSESQSRKEMIFAVCKAHERRVPERTRNECNDAAGKNRPYPTACPLVH